LVREGRLVMKLPEGAVCTTWWRNGELHRDPKEGPAWHRQDPGFERMEYFFNGTLHRDPQDGPALIDGNFDGRGIRIEEYLTCGMPHRPSTLGPAAIHTGPNGQRVLEVYLEYGRLHRDPARGPALITYDADGAAWPTRSIGSVASVSKRMRHPRMRSRHEHEHDRRSDRI
jgi:hypothetical protein